MTPRVFRLIGYRTGSVFSPDPSGPASEPVYVEDTTAVLGVEGDPVAPWEVAEDGEAAALLRGMLVNMRPYFPPDDIARLKASVDAACLRINWLENAAR